MSKDIIILRVTLSYLCFTEGNDIYKTQDLIKFQMLTCSITLYGWMAGCSDIHLLYFNAPESHILNNHHVNLPRKKYPWYKSRTVCHQSITSLHRELGAKLDRELTYSCVQLNINKLKYKWLSWSEGNILKYSNKAERKEYICGSLRWINSCIIYSVFGG